MNRTICTSLLLATTLSVACGSPGEYDENAEPTGSVGTTKQAYIPTNRLHHTIEWAGNRGANGRGCVSVVDTWVNYGPFDGSPLSIYPCDTSGAPEPPAYQFWRFDNVSRAVWHQNNKVMDFPSWGQRGSQLQTWGYNKTDPQKWILANGRLVNGLNGDLASVLCLDVAYGNVSAGSKVLFWNCNDSSSQRWWLFGDETIRPATRWDLCLDLPSGNHTNGTQLQLWNCNDQLPQKWALTPRGVVNNPVGCIDRNIAGGGGPGAKAQIWDCNDQPQQYLWYMGQIRGNLGYCVDVRDGNKAANAAVQGWDCLGTDNVNQQFYVWP